MSGLWTSALIPWLPKSAGSTYGSPPLKPRGEWRGRPRGPVAEHVRGQEVAQALDGHRGVEEPEAAAHDRLVVAADAPGEADARAEVVLVGVDQGVRHVDVGGDPRPAQRLEAGRQQGRDLRVRDDVVAAVLGDEVPEDVALLVPGARELVAQAQEHGQVVVDPPVVLQEDREVVRSSRRCRRVSRRGRPRRGCSPGEGPRGRCPSARR